MPFLEANLDGTTVISDQFLDFNPLTIIQTSLTTKGWAFTESDRSGTSMLRGTMCLGATNKEFTFTIGKIQDQEEGRNPREKRIQISAANTTVGYNFSESENIKYALLGVYKRDSYSDTIICAWPKNVIRNPNTTISVRVKIDLIAKALTEGFANTLNEAGQMVCAFRPEFIQYYLLNKDSLHSIGTATPGNPAISDYPYNLIYFGAPGTGKSNAIDSYTTDDNSVNITFHPDTDYSAFVGSYKPIQAEGTSGISYGFVAQAFLQAYTKAWETEKDTFLIIEEINRGNCAQIFGDIFQIIERGEDGYSKYKIDVDSEIEKYLKKHYEDLISAGGDDEATASRYINYFGGSFKKIALPNNLFLHATMNTSDQSLFPIDSAFKRRWDWEFVPIQFEGTEANSYKIKFGDENYSWRSFVEAVNRKIKTVTDSEDKKLGQFFIKSFDNSITEKAFKAKVMFYIWNDILKDEPQTEEKYFFRRKATPQDAVSTPFTFSDLFSANSTQLLKEFMTYLGIAATQV